MENRRVVLGVFGILCFSGIAWGQDTLRGNLVTAFGDMAAIKQKAEAGDARAQVTLADSLVSNFRPLDALNWYRKAATHGDSEGAYHVGHLLLFGGTGIPKEQTVTANPWEGIQWTFRAATNSYARAFYDMAHASRDGLGVGTNSVEAYAWMQLYADTRDGAIMGRVELNQMALKNDTAVIRQGQQLAEQFKHGEWRQPVISKNSSSGDGLKLGGVTLGASPLAIISGRTLAEGESAKITLKSGTVSLKCLKIESTSVLIQVEGEEAPRRLTLQ